jgi:O-antigen/teichoic acid export membrane protein
MWSAANASGFIGVITLKIVRIIQNGHRVNLFASAFSLTAGTNVLLALLNFVTGILATRLLGPQGRGELAAIQTWPLVITGMAMLGLPQATVYFCGRDPKKAGSYLASAIVAFLLAVLPFLLIGHYLMPWLLASQSIEVVKAAQWYLLMAPVFMLICLSLAPLQGLQDFATWNILRGTPSVGWLMVLLVAGTLGHATPQVLAVGHIVMLGLLFFPIGYVVTRRIQGGLRLRVRLWVPMARYSLPSLLGTIPQLLTMRLDQILIAAILPSEALGFYVIAVAWGSSVSPLLSAVGTTLFPSVASQAGLSQQYYIFAQGSRLGVLLSITTAAMLMSCTPLAVPLLFGRAFAPAIPSGFVLVLAGGIAGINMIMEEGIRGLGYPTSVLRAECAGLVILVIALILLLRPFGILGAAISSLASSSTVALLLLTHAHKLTGYSIANLVCPTTQDLYKCLQQIKYILGIKEKK